MISEEDLPRLVVISSSAMFTVQTLCVRLSCAVAVYVGTGEKPEESSLVVAPSRQGHQHFAT